MGNLFRSSTPTIQIPEQEQSKAYQTLVPQSSFQNAAEYMGRLDKEYNQALNRRYNEVGTSAERGARARGVEMQERASYLASLPKRENSFFGERSNSQTGGFSGGSIGGVLAGGLRGISDNIKQKQSPARDVANMRLNNAKTAYNDAVAKAKTAERSYAPVTQTGFDARQYLENYTDLRDAFGADLNMAREHYLRHGREEGRTDADIYGMNRGAPGFTRFNPDSLLPREMNKPVKNETKPKEANNSKENDFDDDEDD